MTRPENSKVDTAENDAEKVTTDDDHQPDEIDDAIEFAESTGDKLKQAEDRVLRLQADLENFRRRKAKETREQVKYATMPLITSLLDVVDNLQRALSAAESADNDAGSGPLREGVEMVSNQLLTVLENNGCKKIESVGQPFDPNLHEAMQMQPSDTIAANHVMLEVQTGYLLHDRVVRPPKVMVSTGPADEKP